MSFIFSPIPTNLIGLPVTVFTDSAAPPRVSPSSFVRITPFIPSCSLKLSETVTASWPVIESTTNNISFGFANSFKFCNSFISVSSIWSLPAVSMITTSFNFEFASFSAAFTISVTSFSSLFEKTGILSCFPITSNWSIAAGLYISQATIIGFLPCFLSKFASFPAIVVLPEPWRPTSIIIVGGFGERFNPSVSFPPNSSTNSSWTILIICWPGVKLFNTSCPNAFSPILFVKSFTIL